MGIFRGRLTAQLALLALGALVLICLPLLKFGQPWWELSRRGLLPLVLLLAAYGASALAALLFIKNDGWQPALRALGITLSLLGCTLLLLLLARLEAPRYLLLPAFLIIAALVPLSVSAPAIRSGTLLVLGIATIAVIALGARAIALHDRSPIKLVESTARTAFYPLRILSHEGLIPAPATRGGGLDRLGDDVLLGTGEGLFYLLRFGQNGKTADELQVQPLPIRVPLNREEFAAAFGGSSRAPNRAIDYSEAGPPRVQTWRFRVADVIAQERGDTVRILASHHYWKAADQCFAVRLSQLQATRAKLTEAGKGDWQTLYESSPCIPMTGELRKRGKNPFRGEEIGGRMALLDESTLLLTLGDHGFYGLESLQAFAQDPSADYGKTVRIDLNSGAREIYTMGHRNPQGLYVASDGRVWMSEHGAQGGDEINLLARGANYGWPVVTYGTDYGSFAWQLNPVQNRHSGYTQPAMSWVPSVGVSTLIGISGERFGLWKGDLVAGSLATRSLYRIVLDEDRAVLNEPIAIGKRVRDLLEMRDGRLLVWADDAALVTIEPAHGTGGALQFAALCSGCHWVGDGMSHRIGPDLFHINGRDVASAPGFDEYSPALRQLGGTWNRQQLDAFLRDPQRVAPGTTMAFPGIADDAQRAALVEYLEKL